MTPISCEIFWKEEKRGEGRGIWSSKSQGGNSHHLCTGCDGSRNQQRNLSDINLSRVSLLTKILPNSTRKKISCFNTPPNCHTSQSPPLHSIHYAPAHHYHLFYFLLSGMAKSGEVRVVCICQRRRRRPPSNKNPPSHIFFRPEAKQGNAARPKFAFLLRPGGR